MEYKISEHSRVQHILLLFLPTQNPAFFSPVSLENILHDALAL